MKWLSILVLVAAFIASTAVAAPVVRVAIGANGVWLNGPAVDFSKDVEGAAAVSASLSPHISGVAHAFYGFSGNYVRYDGGARITATDVDNRDFNLYLGIVYRNGSTAAVQPGEWAPDAGVGWRPNPKGLPHVVLGADAGYGLSTQKLVSYAAIRWQF